MAATYPLSARSFTTKTTGQGIDPGHVNDLQDEVSAIESGLLNGTAPVNSSNSTVASLSVLGTATFHGPLVLGTQTITLAQGDNNDVALQSSAVFVRLLANSSGSTVTGFASLAGDQTRLLFLSAASTVGVGLAHNSSLSVSTNRLAIVGGSNMLRAGGGAVIVYDTSTGLYRSISIST